MRNSEAKDTEKFKRLKPQLGIAMKQSKLTKALTIGHGIEELKD